MSVLFDTGANQYQNVQSNVRFYVRWFMIRSNDITSVTEHRTHLKEHLLQVNRTGRPLFITTNGQTEAVVLSPVAYDKLAEEAEMARSLAMLDQGMLDIAAGRTQPAKEAIEEIAAKYGIELSKHPAVLSDRDEPA